MKALVWFETHLGAGDAQITALMVKELLNKGIDVTIVSSSVGRWKHIAHFGTAKILPLPPLERRQDKKYYTPSGTHFDEDEQYKKLREKALLEALETTKPDVVVIQGYPLLKTQFFDELDALLRTIEAQPHKPALFALLCDATYVADNPQRTRHAGILERLSRFDSAIIPGDGLLNFENVFPPAKRIKNKIHYAGYFVSPEVKASDGSDNGEVLVSSGGGFQDVDKVFYIAAIRARKYSSLKDNIWRLKISRPACSDETFAEIVSLAHSESPDGKIIVESNDDRFRQQMRDSKLCILRAGYNSLVEAAALGKPVVSIPLPPLGVVKEQQARAQALARAGAVVTMTQAEMEEALHSGKIGKIAHIIDTACSLQLRLSAPLNLNGAENTAQFIIEQGILKGIPATHITDAKGTALEIPDKSLGA